MNEDEPTMVLHQNFTGEVTLTVFANKRDKLADIPLGSDVQSARKKAERLVAAMTLADGFTDKTAN